MISQVKRARNEKIPRESSHAEDRTQGQRTGTEDRTLAEGDSAHQRLSREHLQQRDEAVSISEVLVQVSDMSLGLWTQEDAGESAVGLLVDGAQLVTLTTRGHLGSTLQGIKQLYRKVTNTTDSILLLLSKSNQILLFDLSELAVRVNI